jgi:predicted site-specific integrase-resolvase
MPNDRLRDALMNANLTPDEVAPQLKVDPKTVERWITTGRAPYPKHRHKLAAILRKSEAQTSGSRSLIVVKSGVAPRAGR